MDKVVHFEIPASDLSRANKFYSNVFGWKITKENMPEIEYHTVHTVATDKRGMHLEAGAINGGLIKRDGTAEHPVVVIKVKSVEDYMKKIKDHGGRIVMNPVKIRDMGIYARFSDTEGNVVGIWQDIK